MNPHTTLDTLARQLALFRDTRRAAGRPAAQEIPLIKECYVAPDTATALSEARPFLEAKYRAYQRWEQDKALPEGESFELTFEALGVTAMIFRLQWPGMEQARVLRSIRLLGERVLPSLG